MRDDRERLRDINTFANERRKKALKVKRAFVGN
jgi:hypothetical protein